MTGSLTRRTNASELEQLAGIALNDLTRGMVEALDPDRQLAAARETSDRDEPGIDELAAATRQLLDAAVEDRSRT